MCTTVRAVEGGVRPERAADAANRLEVVMGVAGRGEAAATKPAATLLVLHTNFPGRRESLNIPSTLIERARLSGLSGKGLFHAPRSV